jgi:hypothetical protein
MPPECCADGEVMPELRNLDGRGEWWWRCGCGAWLRYLTASEICQQIGL